MSNLIPKIDFYLQNNMNVLLIGKHGVGKSYALMDAARRNNLKLKYFSCSTLDPFTDLVGIPYPEDDKSNLKMIRPRDIDEADVVFFDELNRAPDTKTLNAILEIVQFHTINGEPLNVKSVWAAINPVDDNNTYDVHELDPALLDRFDVYEEIHPRVDVEYLSAFMDRKIAQALFEWWDQFGRKEKESYISPRRIEKIGRVVQVEQGTSVVKKMMPLGEKFNTSELILRLNVALGKKTMPKTPMGAAPATGIVYTRQGLKNSKKDIIKILKDPNVAEATIDNVIKVLEDGIGWSPLVAEFGPILEVLPTSRVEAMINSWNPSKRSLFKGEVRRSKGLPNLKSICK